MRVTGNFSEAEDKSQNDATQQEPAANSQSPPVGFEPFNFHGYAGPAPPPYSWVKHDKQASRKKVYFSEPEASGYSSTDDVIPRKQSASKLPPFARKWFDLSKDKKDELRQIRHQWISDQTASGNPAPNTDVEGMKKVLPKFAAKWFVLPEEDKEKYRDVKKAKKAQKKGGVDIPPFAAKWFALSDKKKNEFRAIKRRLKMSKKAWLSDGDGEADHTAPEIDYQHEGVPPFAAKWFSLPKEIKDEIRMKYRHHKKCKKHDCKGLETMMGMVQLQGATPGQPIHPMMYPYSGYPMPWMGQYYQQGYPCAYTPQPYMWAQCPMTPLYCLMKRMHKAEKAMRRQQGWETSDTSDDDVDRHAHSSSDTTSSDEEVTEMPPFVKKWFALPMEARQQLRMLKRQQKEGKFSHVEGIPNFATKWFALPEKTKQKMRKINRQQHPGCGKQQMKATNDDITSQSPRDPKAIDVTLKSDAMAKEIPEFARTWFSLPVEQKYHLRMLNRYLSSKSGGETSEDEYSETMPEFAAQWFALSSEERQHLRDLKHDAKPKEKRERKKGWKRFSGRPWQQWAFHAMPSMGYFGGKKHGHYQPVPESCHECQHGYFD